MSGPRADEITDSAGSSAPEITGRVLQAHHRRSALLLIVAAVVCVLVALISAGIGPAYIQLPDVVRIIGHHLIAAPGERTWSVTADTIVWVTRVPRVIMGMATGATLAMAGAALQAMVRNPLADPYILGVNSGASTGAAIAIVVFAGSGGGALLLSGSAFLGALGATLLVLAIAGSRSEGGPMRLIMAGMAVGYALSAATNFLIFTSDSAESSRSVMFWMLGSLANVHWSTAMLSSAVGLVVLVLLGAQASTLDVLASGDEAALTLGVTPQTARIVLMLVVSLAVGVVVAGAGSIGFVGLVIPHLARALVGSRHRVLIPASALLGAAFLVLADVGARMLFAPQEMPIGVITGLVGAPFLLALVHQKKTTRRSAMVRRATH
ncbi:FecCD family ABC transporter permease [Propionicicella superfundia]|uniref:FecCD family ABC transporter permease n=1 Tax=Propionicicella superfundia TaxID=348582 RepID=UPI0006847A40|nr:iron ABC transporter permease [Propionicicella superfundia]